MSGGHSLFYITSLDRSVGYIYPLPVWRENLKFLRHTGTIP